MAFNGWTIRKGIAPRDAKGQFDKSQRVCFMRLQIVCITQESRRRISLQTP